MEGMLRAAISASRLMRGKSGKQNRHRNKRLGASQVSKFLGMKRNYWTRSKFSRLWNYPDLQRMRGSC